MNNFPISDYKYRLVLNNFKEIGKKDIKELKIRTKINFNFSQFKQQEAYEISFED